MSTDPRKVYDAGIQTPQPDDGAAFVLICYDKVGPFGPGATHYSVDRLEIDPETKERYGYREEKLIIQFPKDIMYVLISRDVVVLLDSEKQKEERTAASKGLEVHATTDTKEDSGEHKGYL